MASFLFALFAHPHGLACQASKRPPPARVTDEVLETYDPTPKRCVSVLASYVHSVVQIHRPQYIWWHFDYSTAWNARRRLVYYIYRRVCMWNRSASPYSPRLGATVTNGILLLFSMFFLQLHVRLILPR